MPAPDNNSNSTRVLFVDDEPVLCNLSQALLASYGFEVRTASDGLDALRCLTTFSAHVLISDLRMPRMSGFELLSIVRRRMPHIVLIALSGEFCSPSEVIGIADAFFSKGEFTPDTLVESIRNLVATPPERPSLETPPIWIPASPSGEVILTCTNCLRSFILDVRPEECNSAIHERKCPTCDVTLRFHIDLIPTRIKRSATMAAYNAA